MRFPALYFTWHAGANCMKACTKVAQSYFVEGEMYRLEAVEERSGKAHRRYFAVINEAWKSLPEDEKRFPSPEHLRKYALIKSDYYDEDSIVLPTRKDALSVAGWTRKKDGFSVIMLAAVEDENPDGPTVVRVFTAKSQSIRNMKNDEWKASSDKVLHWIDDLLGVAPGTVSKQKESA